MKSVGSMAAMTRRQYSEALKHEAVRLVRDSARPVAQVARGLGISESLLYRWRAQHQLAEAQGTTRAIHRTEAEELMRLKRELVRVTQERDFLRRAAGSLTRGHPNEIPGDPGARPSLSHPAHVPSAHRVAGGLLRLAGTV
jgi:transposase